MPAPPSFATEFERLRYVLDVLSQHGITESDLARAAGFARTEVGTMLARLERGERVSTEKWRALYYVLRPDLSWWVLGTGKPGWRPDDVIDDIRERSEAAKQRAAEERIARAEAEDDEPKSTQNVLRLHAKKSRRTK